MVRCCSYYISKKEDLAIPLIEGLLRYWPFGNSTKETMFLSELSEVLEQVKDPKDLKPLIPRLFTRLTKCIAGSHLQVSDRTMCFFENEYFIAIIKEHKNFIFPMLVPVIVSLARDFK